MDFRQCFQLVTSVGCSPARPSYLTDDKIITDKVDYLKYNALLNEMWAPNQALYS